MTSQPATIGPYRIVSLLGEGGAGTVYLAEREVEGYRQRVALKLLQGDLPDSRRAEERRILARLEHPGIARLIDGGTTAEGQGFIVVEFVEGMDLLSYADRHRLTIRQRLELFREICDAVAYAHQRLVVHRDIKPANILVDQQGRTKLLDFGVAVLLDQSGEEGAVQPGSWLTPSYASPEQIKGGRVTTLSDVYSLGTVLYELLAGRRPYELDAAPRNDMERIVCYDPVARPSEAATRTPRRVDSHGSLEASPESVARARQVTTRRLGRILRGDLDGIVLKAMARDPEQRYDSVAQLSGDIEQFLADRPVSAASAGPGYRTVRFIRRHRSLLGAGVAAVFLLLAGLAATAWQARRATTQRNLALSQAEKAALVTSLMVDLFRLSDPTETRGSTVTAREVLERGVTRIERDFGHQPEVQAAVFGEVAQVYANLGILDRAEELARRSLTLTDSLYGGESLESSVPLARLASFQATAGKSEEAITAYRRAIALRAREREGADSLLARMRADLAWQLRNAGQYEEARQLFDEALAAQRLRFGDAHPEVAATMLGLAATYHDRGRFDDAERLFREALARYDTASGPPHAMAATALQNIGMIRRLREQYREAEPLLSRALAMSLALYDSTHPATLEAAKEWGRELKDLGRLRESGPYLRSWLEQSLTSLGPDHPTTLSIRDALGTLLLTTGNFPEARAQFDTLLSIKQLRYEAEHPQLRLTWLRSGEAFFGMGDLDQAETRYRNSLPPDAGNSLPGGIYGMLAAHRLAQVARARGNLAEAERLLDHALAVGEDQLRENHRYNLMVRRDKASLLTALGQPRGALALLEPVLQAELAKRGEPHYLVGFTLIEIAAAHRAAGNVRRQRESLRRALSNLAELPPDHRTVRSVQGALGG